MLGAYSGIASGRNQQKQRDAEAYIRKVRVQRAALEDIRAGIPGATAVEVNSGVITVNCKTRVPKVERVK